MIDKKELEAFVKALPLHGRGQFVCPGCSMTFNFSDKVADHIKSKHLKA